MSKFFCILCGTSYSSIQSLTSGTCHKNKEGNRKHILYEGQKKEQYTCKYCGISYKTISSLTSGSCSKSPNKYHIPTL